VLTRFLFQPNKLVKRLYPKAVWSIKCAEPTLYLTFDDGPIPGLTEWVLDELKQHNVKATFFCVGENILKYPAIYQRIKAEGHAVANHTFNHIKGFRNGVGEYMDNVEKCESLTQTKLFRPPYGQLKKSQYKALLNKKYRIILWDVVSYDYESISPEQCFRNVKNKGRNGSIVLFHDNLKAEKNIRYALPKTIDHFLKLNYNLAALTPP